MSAVIEKSQIKWTGEEVMAKHEGKVALSRGYVKLKRGQLKSGSFVIDMTEMTCDDLKGEDAQKLINHLKSPDFFDVEQYPIAKLDFKKSVFQPRRGYKVTADLTIKDITKEISFMAILDGDKKSGEKTLKAKIIVDRSKYNVKYRSASFFKKLKDKVIYDDFVIEVSVFLKK